MLWNDLQQYFAENPNALVGVYCVGYLVIVFAIKIGKDNAQFAMLVFKALYFTVGLPLLIFNGLFKFFYRLIFKRPLTKNTAKASAPNIVISNPEVQIVRIRDIGDNNWNVEIRTRSDRTTSSITVSPGAPDGTSYVNGVEFSYSAYF